ncbi:pectinesterase family protein [[Pseudomonas] boreopolis]|uniref:pectinesterase family protein n=1 Tax=Xanthomonas boreopolis TaxID=86183 RepID=UPI003D4A72E4
MVTTEEKAQALHGRNRMARARRRRAGWAMLAWTALAAIPAQAAEGWQVLRVAASGGDFARVQEAVDAAVRAQRPTEIRIAAGDYRERVNVPSNAPPLHMVGASATLTRIVFDNYAARIDPATGQPFGTSGSASVVIAGNDFTAEKLAFGNDAGPVGQAVAVRLDGDRMAFRDVRFLGHQDTLYLRGTGLAYFRDCHVEGTVDFIFGAGTGLFEGGEIRSIGDGYVTAASTPDTARAGLVFRNVRLTAANGVSRVYLGRPWRPYAQVAFVGSELGAHVLPAGWHDWDKPETHVTARFGEHGNRGPGADTSRRAAWARLLSAAEAAQLDAAHLLGSWRPFP